ncbi:MAG: hypothetical protein U5K30_04190 [Acidimicrobiales bacterium]|nr:hypothetical protein [Acidimicrobiales bacterium]
MADDPRIDPDDLRGVRFPRSFGRYEAKAVDDFLESVARRVEATNRMIDDLQADIGQQEEAPRASSSAITVLPGPGAEASPPETPSDLADEPPSPFEEPVSAPARVETPDLATLSDDELSRLVGDETAHVLSTARSAAADIRAKAEDSAARVIREATAEAKRLTDDARAEADALTTEASTARDTAVAEAEEAAAAIRTTAEEEAARIRSDADRAAAEAAEAAEQIRAAAEDEAAAAIEEARTEGRSMVAEAKRVRARILTDLQRRRDIGREQVDRLVAGRNRLLDAYAAVRANVDEITSHLDTALLEASGPEGDLDDEVVSAVADAEAVAGDIRRRDDPEPATPVDNDDHDDAGVDHAPAEVSGDDDDAGDDPELDESPPEGPGDGHTAAHEPAAAETEHATQPESPTAAEPGTNPGPGPVADDAVDDAATDAGDDPDGAGAVGEEDGGNVEELFSRIRAERAESVARAQQVLADEPVADAGHADETDEADGATDESAGAADEDDGATDEADARAEDAADRLPAEMRAEGPVHRHRAETIETLEKALSRALKRHLADEQNEVLDALRTSESTAFDDLVPIEADHVAGYADVATKHLLAAAQAGASQVEGGDDGDLAADAGEVAAVLGESLIAPFRRRIERSAADVDGDADALDERLRALYREWKVEHISPAAGDAVVAAYSAGQVAAAAADATLRWLIEPGSRSCPDCHDNALAGAINKGQAFPTEVDHPPAHPGCRCLLAVDA